MLIKMVPEGKIVIFKVELVSFYDLIKMLVMLSDASSEWSNSSSHIGLVADGTDDHIYTML